MQVTFEGVVGLDAFSDIAIDDVEFQENTACAKTAETLGKDLIIQIQNELAHVRRGLNLQRSVFFNTLDTITPAKGVFSSMQITF